MAKTIIAYLTADKERVLGGEPLTLLITDDKERADLVWTLCREMQAHAMELPNGDYIVLTPE